MLLALLPGRALLAQDTEAALALAEQAAEAGDMAEVRRLLGDAFGSEAATLPTAPPPQAGQTLLEITTTPGERLYELRLLPTGEAAVHALLERAAAALEGVTPARLAAGRLTIRVPFSNTADLLETQARLDAALPADPELALLAAALAPDAFEWRTEVSPFAHSAIYREEVNLEPAGAACTERVEALAAAAASATGEDRLAGVQAKLWAADAEAWRAFCARSHATYRVELDPQRPARRWDVAAGSGRVLNAEARLWRLDRVVWLVGAVGLLIVFFVAALWRASARATVGATTEYTEQTEA